ncbi:MAG TPA: LLM class F420-dependent oxidoreductase, partial [Mycobacterium sp.]|nr:LLM class F420-dependent oxidoreductase [Mycobacterium sp.]
YAELGIEQVNVGPLPGNTDPIGFIERLGVEIVPKLTELG